MKVANAENVVTADSLKDMIVNIRSNVELIHSDYSVKGIYEQSTIYLWTYLGTEEKVIKTVNTLYPNTFYLFEPLRIKDKNSENKIILKINKTFTSLPKIEEEPKSGIQKFKEYVFQFFNY